MGTLFYRRNACIAFIVIVSLLLVSNIVFSNSASAAASPESDIPVEGPRTTPTIDSFVNKDAGGLGIKSFSTKGLLAWVPDQCAGPDGEGKCSLCDIIQVGVNIGNFVLAIFGAVALLMFLWGGFCMVTSRGDSEKIDSAKSVLWNALAGSVFILISWQLVAVIVFLLTGHKNPFEGVCP